MQRENIVFWQMTFIYLLLVAYIRINVSHEYKMKIASKKCNNKICIYRERTNERANSNVVNRTMKR